MQSSLENTVLSSLYPCAVFAGQEVQRRADLKVQRS
jgi:hypothetical protein